VQVSSHPTDSGICIS